MIKNDVLIEIRRLLLYKLISLTILFKIAKSSYKKLVKAICMQLDKDIVLKRIFIENYF
jgi:hypothetical protein